MKKCIIKNCPGQRLFRFPKEGVSNWCNNLQIEESELNTRSRVCSRHFEPKWVGPFRLRKGAIPTDLAGHDIKPDREIKKYEDMCCIVNCSHTRRTSTLHKFPKEKTERELWKSLSNIEPTFRNHCRLYICQNHFYPRDIVNKTLKRNARPIEQIGADTSEKVAQSQNGNLEIHHESLPDEYFQMIVQNEDLMCPGCEVYCSKYYEQQKELEELKKKIECLQSQIDALTKTSASRLTQTNTDTNT